MLCTMTVKQEHVCFSVSKIVRVETELPRNISENEHNTVLIGFSARFHIVPLSCLAAGAL